MKFDPKWAFIWGLVTTILTFLAATGLPNAVDPHISEIVKSWSTWLAALFAAITTFASGFSSSASGPLVNDNK